MAKKKRSNFSGKTGPKIHSRLMDKANRRAKEACISYGPQSYHSQAPSVSDPKYAQILIHTKMKGE